MKSIAHRIYKAIFAISIICIVLIISTVLIVNEDLEGTILRGTTDQASASFPASMDRTQAFVWDGELNKLAYIPSKLTDSASLPAVFSQMGLQDRAEITYEGSTFLVNIERYAEGTFYWARNIDAFEIREKKLHTVVLIIALLIAGLSFLLALYCSRKIVQPLQNLTQQINNLPIGQEFATLEANYQDRELNDIAKTFNFFLTELESYIQREKQLLNLASHELRTPIAVTAGALDVIEARQQLQANDKHTLQRIRRANEEMGNNVTILLQLARGTLESTAITTVELYECANEVIVDLEASYPTKERITLTGHAQIMTHPSLVKMLLRNLIQNALQHTMGHIKIHIDNKEIVIQDQGSNLQNDMTWANPSRQIPTSGGLGLYLVTLMCEKLGWSLKTEAREHAGTRITLKHN